MANWAGNWTLGAGYQLTSTAPAYTFVDPKYIRSSETSVFHKMLVTLGGARRLFGKRDNFPIVEIAIADDSAVANLCADPPLDTMLTLTPPSGTARTATARVVSDSMEEVGPQAELARVIRFACSTTWS